MKNVLCTTAGVVGGFIASLFGGGDTSIATLVLFMGIDFFSGLAIAGIFKNSNKTENGALESRAGFKELCRKRMTLFFVLNAFRLDLAIGSNYIRDAVIIGFMANELIFHRRESWAYGVTASWGTDKSHRCIKEESCN